MHNILFRLIRLSGLPILFREMIQQNKVTILLFHDISQKTAENTFIYLSKKYNIIDLNDFVDALDNKTSLPKKAMILTFDDGNIRNYEILPVIKKLNIPITIFLTTSIINTNRHFWFKFKNPSITSSKLKLISNKERLAVLSKVGFDQEKEFDEPQALQKTQIDEMKNFINMQAHTMYHPFLPKCNYEEARNEIFNSKKTLEKEYNLKINAIAYPNGDYSDRDILLVKQAGYKCGITVDYGYNTIETDKFRLKRISVNDTENRHELIVKASGLWSFFKTINGHKQQYGFTDKTE